MKSQIPTITFKRASGLYKVRNSLNDAYCIKVLYTNKLYHKPNKEYILLIVPHKKYIYYTDNIDYMRTDYPIIENHPYSAGTDIIYREYMFEDLRVFGQDCSHPIITEDNPHILFNIKII